MNKFLFFLYSVTTVVFVQSCACNVVSEAVDPAQCDTVDCNYSVNIDACSPRGVIPNVVSNINVWSMGSKFINPVVKGDCNIFDFVEYVQLMTATGGNPSRDLFKDPSDRTVLDDYDFEKLIGNCHGILSLGAKPHIKFGNIPSKFTKDYAIDVFGVNIYSPQDYQKYYTYIRAIVQALCDEFGREELLSWHYGVFTEYENKEWFQGADCTPESAAEEFCKIYDWTVQALIDVLGEDRLYVGAHSMTVTEGLWDERIFIRHCAEGINWANGGKGSHISYLSASFYDYEPGKFTPGFDLPHTILHLKEAAESYGLDNLVYGVDEGRILSATTGTLKRDLYSRTTGYTYMAAYDARLYTQMIDVGGSYFSSWEYLSKNNFEGNPSVSYHVASNISRLAGMNRIPVTITDISPVCEAEAGALAGVDQETGKTMFMLYNFSNDVNYSDTVTLNVTVKTGLKSGLRDITISKINDDCNWFDEWSKDRIERGITDDKFLWSPDDGCCIAQFMADSTAAAVYNELESSKYADLSRLIPKTGKIRVTDDGTFSLRCSIGGNNVWFVEVQ